ncbi:MAG: glutamine--fructose-6-phosphate transaminase (isomerizing) [Bacilli bacterium]|nr:glutamine--fructose-6-phosphate transaminase (isomerizing) [Bacilli bacterium]
MCGIVGYNGKNKAIDILLDGLSKLEYRGYDSAGVAVQEKDIKIYKAKGKIINLEEKLKNKKLNGTCGIGHTRWATHGEPSETNAHPHVSNDQSVTLVHNGIIENYQELIKKLQKHGYIFYSQTDTEVLANLIDYYYKKYKNGPSDAINRTMVRVRGSYAIAVMFKNHPDEIWVARKDSPMIIGKGKDGVYLASDVPAILKYTNNVYYIDNLESACLKKDEIIFYDLNGDTIEKELKVIDWDITSAEKEGYEHFMIKEIHEQPEVIKKTISSYINDGSIDFTKCNLTKDILKNVEQIYIVACGSAYHVGVCASYVIEDLARVPVRVDVASEFRYKNPLLKENDLVIIISQSGETADSLAALREAKNRGIKTLAIVNVVGSSIAREADYVLYTLAGPEIAVATTKAFSTQLIVSYLLAIELACAKKQIDKEVYSDLLKEMQSLPEKVNNILNDDLKGIQKIASELSSAQDAFYIGRGLDYAISLEGSLKLKEISYIHSEAYAAGELKHGTISLIEDNTLVIGVVTQEAVYEKTLSNLTEVKARGGYILTISPDNIDVSKVSNYKISIPKTNKFFYPSLTVIPLQLLGYYIAVSRGVDVDKPRNLAKSVTVE